MNEDGIVNAIDVIVSGIKAFVEGVDWRDLGEKMGEWERLLEQFAFYKSYSKLWLG